jgi:hypothetical protein
MKNQNDELKSELVEAVKKSLAKKPKSKANKWKEMQKSMPQSSTIVEYTPEDEADIPNLEYSPDPTMAPPPVPAYPIKKMSSMPFTQKIRSTSNELRTKEPDKFNFLDEIKQSMDDETPLPSNIDDVDIIRNALIIERVPERMKIIVVAVDTEVNSGNDINLIKCEGEPLGCYAYDAKHDGYLVSCAGYTDLGSVSVAYRIKSQGSLDNNNIIALPDELVEKYLTPNQKRTLKAFREKYATPRYAVQFMQAINC